MNEHLRMAHRKLLWPNFRNKSSHHKKIWRQVISIVIVNLTILNAQPLGARTADTLYAQIQQSYWDPTYFQRPYKPVEPCKASDGFVMQCDVALISMYEDALATGDPEEMNNFMEFYNGSSYLLMY